MNHVEFALQTIAIIKTMSRPKKDLSINELEYSQLNTWSRSRKESQARVLRARIVLACATGKDNAEVAEELGVTPQTVSKWRNRFALMRCTGLSDAPRSGRPRTKK